MIIDALGLTEHIIITVDTEEAFKIAPYRAQDPKIDAINRLRELGYDVEAQGYVEPIIDKNELPKGVVF